jgi:hypothetical protein
MNESTQQGWAGDPTLLGWGTTFAYLLTFLLLLANVRKARAGQEPFSFWLVASLAIFALGVNKQLDLQTWLHNSAKAWIEAKGLYEHKQTLQLGFVAVIALGGLATVWLLRRWIMNSGRRYRLVFIGLGVSIFFVVTRAASIYIFDPMIGSAEATEAVGATLEIAALVLIVVGAMRWRRRPSA